MDLYILIGCFFVIALVYSSVGFAGGTSYLALMGVMAIDFEVMRPAALLCNILVATGGTMIFYRENLLDLKKNWPFLVASVPCAFVGGLWPIKENAFFLILGFTLIGASLFLWVQNNPNEDVTAKRFKSPLVPFELGAGIGFLSGLVSIGGGIFLSPILHFINWDNARKISALASIFILVNSISGLAGNLVRLPTLNWQFITPLLASVFVGGQIGSRLGARKFNLVVIKRVTAVLVLLAGLNILKDHLL